MVFSFIFGVKAAAGEGRFRYVRINITRSVSLECRIVNKCRGNIEDSFSKCSYNKGLVGLAEAKELE